MIEPEILYKYRSWNSDIQKSPLTQSELYLSSPMDFNDPFDCRIPSNFKAMTQEDIEEYAGIIIKNHSKIMIELGWDLNEEYRYIVDRINEDSESFQNEFQERTFDGYDKHLGVLSLSKRWDSILMWSHYADYHKGYCIGFHKEMLTSSDFFGAGGPVIYPDNSSFPEITPAIEFKAESQFIITHHKAFDWKYEEEYRFTKLQYPKPFEKSERIIKVPDNFIAEVLIGLKAEASVEKEIIDFCKLKKIPVFKLAHEPLKFKLVRNKINHKN
ncbi:DUF2971 domain-containing protein [Cyclobacterium plantarum]|uniref:DUF2971 domain-containing protein n=1 Tax=Cyclobacterium plantarum TaxID=2716263 RepID=A0ABX0HER1_9BACT|nr:DUF2971 domain-containing protein [Cyclobacterium plantarum]NHE58490.1 DUF2971 domain-containing protein [Cyclobacterium plantarum]